MPTPFSTATERDALRSTLDWQREALIEALDGLSEADVRRTPTASSLSLLSLAAHAGLWERRWFQIVFAGHDDGADAWPSVRDAPAASFALREGDTVAAVVARYRAAAEVSNEILASGDLDALCVHRELTDLTLRGVALHLIQETARHAGHADIIRETIDGRRASG